MLHNPEAGIESRDIHHRRTEINMINGAGNIQYAVYCMWWVFPRLLGFALVGGSVDCKNPHFLHNMYMDTTQDAVLHSSQRKVKKKICSLKLEFFFHGTHLQHLRVSTICP